MKVFLIIALALGAFYDASAQYISIIPRIIEPKAAKRLKYKINTWKYLYEIELKDGSVLTANSDILREKDSDKYFIYYFKDDSLIKIYPQETLSIKKPNPYNMQEYVEGVPYKNQWRFKVLGGKINAFCYFLNGRQITEIQIGKGEVIPLDPEYLRLQIQNSEKALDAWDKKDYYTAIKIHNKQKERTNTD